jgi:hypothetical protein
MSYGFGVWDADGRQLVRMDDYTMRVLGSMRIPRMTSDRQTYTHPASKGTGVRAFLSATEGYGFFLPLTFTGFTNEITGEFVEDYVAANGGTWVTDNYHDRPDIILGDGAFTLQMPAGITSYNRARGVPYSSPPMFVWFFSTG